MAESVWTVPLERHEFLSRSTSFPDVLERIHAGLGHPDLAVLRRRLSGLTDWNAYQRAVEQEVGDSGLMVFLQLDLGDVLARSPRGGAYQAVRIIAGNPVTMAAMVRTTPAAGAFAPITILVFESDDGVHCRYDTMVSATAGEITDEATEVAHKLDAAVLDLLSAAAADES